MIVEPLINLESIDVKSDRKGMYNLCSNLLHNLLGDIHEEVLKATEEEVKDSVKLFLENYSQMIVHLLKLILLRLE